MKLSAKQKEVINGMANGKTLRYSTITQRYILASNGFASTIKPNTIHALIFRRLIDWQEERTDFRFRHYSLTELGKTFSK